MKLPPPLSWFYDAWMEFSHVLGRIMSTIILTVLWIVGFGTYAVVLKIMRLIRPENATGSTWVDAAPLDADHFKQPF